MADADKKVLILWGICLKGLATKVYRAVVNQQPGIFFDQLYKALSRLFILSR